jgi:hypothetical protein
MITLANGDPIEILSKQKKHQGKIRILKFLFWQCYNLEFSKGPISMNNIKLFMDMIGIEDYEDTDNKYYDLIFKDIRKWYLFKMKHGLTFKDDSIN